jgi:RNA polymerase-binding transcription factor DksA
VFDRDRDLAELALLESDLARVADTLRRLDDGTYGKCEVCGTEIPAAVAADPLAARCDEHEEPVIVS